MLGRSASVGSATERRVAMRLGIARRLQIGNAIFENVVFIVLPDSELGLPPSYRINVFIGLPVLMALGRLEFVNSGSPRLLYDFSRIKTGSEARAHPNMLLFGLEPLLLVRVPGAGNPLRMKLDTGSDRTYFTRNAIRDAPALFAHAKKYVWHVGSAGGVVTERQALRVAATPFTIGERRIVLKNVIVNSRVSSTSDGEAAFRTIGLGTRLRAADGRLRRGTSGAWPAELPFRIGNLTRRSLATPDNRRSRPLSAGRDWLLSGRTEAGRTTPISA